MAESRGRVARLLLPAIVVALPWQMAGCRDAPALLDPPELEPLGPAPYQLTFDPGRELAPSWSTSGDSVIYVTERIGLNPDDPQDPLRFGRPLKVIHREGGVAQRVFPLLQPSEEGDVPIDFAAQAADGRVAAFTLLPPFSPTLCGNDGSAEVCAPPVPQEAPPRLRSALLRVRDSGAVAPPDLDPLLDIQFPGRTFDTSVNPNGFSGVWRVDMHPFQRRFLAERRVPSRVSWSPEGDRVAYSDGVSLRLWNPVTGADASIPGGEDGIDPAWSPTGTWIAFERFQRGALTEAECEHRQTFDPPETEPGPVVCIERRRTWPLLGRTLALIRPDGGELRLLPEGSRPSWGADATRVYYESDRRIWSVGLDGQDPTAVPGTQDGFHPAVSPDGRWLAFARIDSVGVASNIWIVELEP